MTQFMIVYNLKSAISFFALVFSIFRKKTGLELFSLPVAPQLPSILLRHVKRGKEFTGKELNDSRLR